VAALEAGDGDGDVCCWSDCRLLPAPRGATCHQAIRTAGRAVRGTSVVPVPAVPATGRDWGRAEQGSRWACGNGIRVGLVGALFWPGGPWWSRRAAPPPPPAGRCRCPAPGRWPPRPVPGRSWTQRGRRRRARCGAGADVPPDRGPAGGDYDQTPAQFRGLREHRHHMDAHRSRAGGRPGRPAGRDQPDGAHLQRIDLVAVRRAAAAAGARAAARVVLLAAFAPTCLPRCRHRGVRH